MLYQIKFKNDTKNYICATTCKQFTNLKQLPVIVECKVIKTNYKNLETFANELHEMMVIVSRK